MTQGSERAYRPYPYKVRLGHWESVKRRYTGPKLRGGNYTLPVSKAYCPPFAHFARSWPPVHGFAAVCSVLLPPLLLGLTVNQQLAVCQG